MAAQLCLTIRFLDRCFHGRNDGGFAEWPPSPLRAFQALVAAAAAGSPNRQFDPKTELAFRWLERLGAPVVFAPTEHVGQPFRTAVPNNDLDTIVSSWAKGHEPKKQANELKTLKTVRTTWMLDGEAVHYLWSVNGPITQEVQDYIARLSRAAQGIVVLGWGLDLAIGDAKLIPEGQTIQFSETQWVPDDAAGGTVLRVAAADTFDGLTQRHREFLNRLSSHGYVPPAPFMAFDSVAYRRATDPPHRSLAAFSLLSPDATGFRPFDTEKRSLTVAGMMRHVAKRAAIQSGWPKDKVDAFILGHAEDLASGNRKPVGKARFAYMPIPSLERRKSGGAPTVGSVRRVMLTILGGGCDEELAWARRTLSGYELIDEDTGEIISILSLLPLTDSVIRPYLEPAETWVTVTPVLLPGFDDPAHLRRRLRKGVPAQEQRSLLDRLDARVDGLLRKAIIQAGFSAILAEHADLEWRKVGFLPGVGHATNYGVPDHLRRFPRVHVRIHWRDSLGNTLRLPGPFCLGGGRFNGLGLFVAEPG